MTSASIPSAASVSAAASARSTISSVATIVTSAPARTIARLADLGDPGVAAADRALAAVQALVLEEEHRVVVADRRAQHAVGAGRRPRGRDEQPGEAP